MINNCLMFHQNIFIICVLIQIFIYFGKKTMKIFLKIYVILKARANCPPGFYQKLFKFGQICV